MTAFKPFSFLPNSLPTYLQLFMSASPKSLYKLKFIAANIRMNRILSRLERNKGNKPEWKSNGSMDGEVGVDPWGLF